ncbi:MAG TPA: hypothetical protein VKG21_10060 [Casimicrobiaceae bacterium]|nr:hypothetical protein [Casimicrobiaceae bacterium]
MSWRAVSSDIATWQAGSDNRLDTAQRKVEAWLLNRAQVRRGLNQGAVAGAIDHVAGAQYLYPEAAGYFLQWLAWLRVLRRPNRQLAERAADCQRWLSLWIEGAAPPQTRVYVRAHELDWRNSAVFFFDLSMVLRGLASAAEQELLDIDRRLVDALVEWLSKLAAREGDFLACLATSPQVDLPNRWSTRRGAFLAKAAAGVLSASRALPQVNAHLRDAAKKTLASSLLAATAQPHTEVHAQLYAIEGALAPAADDVAAPHLPKLAIQLDAMLAAAMPRGLPWESVDGHGVARVDAAAQCLRAAYLLHALDASWLPEADCLRRMLDALVGQISTEGAVPFAATGTAMAGSVWAAMFAEQALTLSRLRSGDAVLHDARRWIV